MSRPTQTTAIPSGFQLVDLSCPNTIESPFDDKHPFDECDNDTCWCHNLQALDEYRAIMEEAVHIGEIPMSKATKEDLKKKKKSDELEDEDEEVTEDEEEVEETDEEEEDDEEAEDEDDEEEDEDEDEDEEEDDEEEDDKPKKDKKKKAKRSKAEPLDEDAAKKLVKQLKAANEAKDAPLARSLRMKLRRGGVFVSKMEGYKPFGGKGKGKKEKKDKKK